MNTYSYIDNALKYYNKLYNNKKYKLVKQLFYSTQLNGPHVEFYNLPYSFNKNEPIKNFMKFQKNIIKSINNLLLCEKKHIYLHKNIIIIMIEQINNIIIISNSYWENFGMNADDIKKTYIIYKNFLETYLHRINTSRLGETLYQMCIKMNLGINISPNDLQLFAIKKLKDTIKKIESHNQTSIFAVIDKYKKIKTSFSSENELISSIMENIYTLHSHIKNNMSDKIIIPESHKIKIKQMNPMIAKWNLDGYSFERFFFINMSNIDLYRKELLLMLCSREISLIMLRTNLEKNINDYFSNNKVSIHIQKLIKIGINSLNNGIATYMEHMISKLYDINYFYLTELLNYLRILLDTALNSNNVKIKINIDTAKNIIEKFTILNDEAINAEINKYLASPAQLCSYGFGYHIINLLQNKYLQNGYDIKDFYDFIYTTPLTIQTLFHKVNSLGNI